MTNAPTNTAMSANTRKKMVMKPSCSPIADCVSSVISAPLTTSVVPSSSCSAIDATRSSCDTPSSATAPIEVNLPGSPIRRWASSRPHNT